MFRNFPLQNHTQAFKAAEAALCAHDQDQFWPYHDAIFAGQATGMSVEQLKQYAVDLQLNTDEFNRCLDQGRFAETVSKDLADGQAYGVSATPTFFINGRLISGAVPFEEFQLLIDEELSRASGQ